MNTETFIVSIATEAERPAAIEYVSRQFEKKYGTVPPPSETPRDLFIAKEKGGIVGALAIQFGTEGILPHEKLFAFDESDIPIKGYDRTKAIYYSRWNSSRKDMGKVLWLAASRYAEYHGMVYSASSGKPFIYLHFKKEFGCEWLRIPNARLIRENVAASDANYFLTEPYPEPYVGIIKVQTQTLPHLLEEVLREGRIRIETPGI